MESLATAPTAPAVTAPASPLAEVTAAYRRILQLSGDDAILPDFLMSVYISNVHPRLTEPVWAQLIAPPGSCKTESLRPFVGDVSCVFVSSLTENALLSGYSDEEGNDPSLIPQLNGKVLVWKDLTTLINDNPVKVTKIMGDLRDAFDGFCAKPSGRTGLRSYISRFGVIAAVTPAIDVFSESNQQLGERFVSLRLCRYPAGHSEKVDWLINLSDRCATKEAWRTELRQIVQRQLAVIRRTATETAVPEISPRDERTLAQIAHLASQFRTTPVNGSPTDAESGSRLLQQLRNLVVARAVCDSRTRVNESDLILARRVALDTLTTTRRRILMVLYNRKEGAPFHDTAGLASVTRTPPSVVAAIISQYLYNEVVDEIKGEKDSRYRLSADIIKLTSECGLFSIGPHLPSLRAR
jgi:hypothetical protein